jgi:hypothetical protein
MAENNGLVFRIEHDVAEITSGGLFGADALTQLAGTRLQHLHRDAILRLEGFGDRFGGGNPQERGVKNEAAFGLGGGDDLVPIRNLGGRPAASAEQHKTDG